MACGTPVIAMRHGSVPEVMVDGVTGFICESMDEMVEAVSRIHDIDRRACRQHAETRFSVEAMTDGYQAVYRQVTGIQ
jgi:glycosyltransferase involved in cell wall biosynthesis